MQIQETMLRTELYSTQTGTGPTTARQTGTQARYNKSAILIQTIHRQIAMSRFWSGSMAHGALANIIIKPYRPTERC